MRLDDMLDALNNKTIAEKLRYSFRWMTGLLLFCGVAGLFSTAFLSRSLTFVSGPAWVSANAAMEAVMAVELQMLGASQLALDQNDAQAQSRIDEGVEALSKSIADIREAGVFPADVQDNMVAANQTFSEARTRLVDAERALQTEHLSTRETLHAAASAWQPLAERDALGQQEIRARLWVLHGLDLTLALLDGREDVSIDEAVRGFADVGAAMLEAHVWSAEQMAAWDAQGERYVTAWKHYQTVSQAYAKESTAFLDTLHTIEKMGDSFVDGEADRVVTIEIVAFVLILLTGVVSLWMSKRMERALAQGIIPPIRNVITMANGLAEGRLDMVSETQSKDETAEMVDAFMRLQASTRDVMSRIGVVVERAGKGDFTHAVDMKGLGGYQQTLAADLNQLMDTSRSGLASVREQLAAMARGEINAAAATLPGAFGELQRFGQQTSDALHTMVTAVGTVAHAAVAGDFSRRVPLNGLQGYQVQLGQSVNDLMGVTTEGLQAVSQVLGAIANGDLSRRVTQPLPGTFGELREFCNRTADSVQLTMDRIGRSLEAAGAGDFSSEVQASDLQGYQRMLAERVNVMLRDVRRNLDDLSRIVTALAQGELTHQADASAPGIYGQIARVVNTTMNTLRTVVQGMQSASDSVDMAAGEVSAGNSSLSVRTQEQSNAVEETGQLTVRLEQTVRNNTTLAVNARQFIETAQRQAQTVDKVVQDTTHAMREIDANSKNIGAVISLIDDIAFQTNLLALNAAVEAARAGDQGRGFAVVASEVRALAQRSAAAAKDISAKVRESIQRAEEGLSLVERSSQAVGGIVGSVNEMNRIITHVADASLEQTGSLEQVRVAIGQLETSIQQNAALVEELSASTESLSDQAREMTGLIRFFRS